MIHTYQKPLTGNSVGVVFGSFAPLHQGHLDLIMRDKKENDGGCIVIVCGFDGDKGEPLMPHNKRYRYVREFFADDDLVAVYAINDTEIGINNSPANHGVFFADSDAMTTRMYAEYYANDDNLALTKEEFDKIAVVADELTRKSRWDKIFLVAPHGVFVDDHSRYMGHSEMKERQELFDILINDVKRTGNWDKVTILDSNYYENFITIVNYVKEIITNGNN